MSRLLLLQFQLIKLTSSGVGTIFADFLLIVFKAIHTDRTDMHSAALPADFSRLLLKSV